MYGGTHSPNKFKQKSWSGSLAPGWSFEYGKKMMILFPKQIGNFTRNILNPEKVLELFRTISEQILDHFWTFSGKIRRRAGTNPERCVESDVEVETTQFLHLDRTNQRANAYNILFMFLFFCGRKLDSIIYYIRIVRIELVGSDSGTRGRRVGGNNNRFQHNNNRLT